MANAKKISSATAAPGFDQPNFSWTSVAGAVKYAVYFYDSTTNTALNFFNSTNLDTNSFKPPALTPVYWNRTARRRCSRKRRHVLECRPDIRTLPRGCIHAERAERHHHGQCGL